MKKYISIVIANFNGEKYLRTCLDSLLNSSFKEFEVLVIDDGSTDKSIKIINYFLKKDNRVILIKNKENLGAAASRNKAIKNAKGKIIVFLDNDTEVKSSWLEELIKPLRKKGEVGGAQSLLIDFKSRNNIQMAGGKLIPQVAWLAPFFHGKRLSGVKGKVKKRNIVAISAALALKKEVISKIGGFDGKEAVYTEDLDLSWRVWIAGYRIVLAPKSLVYHWTKSVANRTEMNATYKQIYFHLAKNSFRSIIKNYEVINIFRYLPLSIAINIGRGFLVLARSGSLSAMVGTILAFWWNLIHLTNTIGERKRVQKTRKFNDKELFKRIFVKDSMTVIYNKHFRVPKVIAVISLFSLLFPVSAQAYIDPGSGSYIIQIIIAAFLGAAFTTKMFWKRIKDFFSKILGGAQNKRDNEKNSS